MPNTDLMSVLLSIPSNSRAAPTVSILVPCVLLVYTSGVGRNLRSS